MINEDRIKAVKSLIGLEKPIDSCINALNTFSWDYDGDPVILNRTDVESVMKRFLDGNLSKTDLEAWADAIELRDDIAFYGSDANWIKMVITTLSTPPLYGPITRESVEQLLGLQ